VEKTTGVSSLPAQDVEDLVVDTSMILHFLDGADALGGSPPRAEAVVVRERGLKVRVVTKSPAFLHLAGHVARKRLLAGLRRDPASRSPLAGVTDEDVIGSLLGARAERLVSTDLTRATDLLPRDLLGALVDGLEASGRFLPVEVRALRLCVGEQRISYPGTHLPDLVTSGGCLMGLPTSWALLSLVHLFWWTDSVKAAARESRTAHRVAFARNRFSVCGDDGLAAVEAPVEVHYGRVVSACGAAPSAGKHFVVSPGPDSSARAVFLERLYEFSVEGGALTRGRRISAVPLRGLVRPEVSQALRDCANESIMVPGNVRLLYAFDAAWANNPGAQVVLLRIIRKGFPGLPRFAERLGLLNGLPMSEGGSGLPAAKPGPELSERRARALLASRQGVTLPRLVAGEVDPHWRLAMDMADWDLAAFRADGTIVSSPPEHPPPPDGEAAYIDCGDPGELASAAYTSVYRSLSITLGPSTTKRPRLGEREMRRAVKSYVESLPPLGGLTPDEILNADLPPSTVWVRRTRGPAGGLLYPRWAGEARASEALARARAFRLAFGPAGRSPTL
jgi:hypothetical protein